MQPFSVRSGRVAEVMRVVARVHDPELDEPVTDMGFIERVEVADDGSVTLDFRLPTYWCSPNFAFLMLDGVREALESLSWRPRFRITLHDHLFAEEVNAGVAEGKPFAEIFDALSPQEDLAELRETFLHKAFQKRQEAALVGLSASRLGGRRHPDAGLRHAGQGERRAGADRPPDPLSRRAEGALSCRRRRRGCVRRLGGRAAYRGRIAGLSRQVARRADQHGVQRRALPRPERGALPGEGGERERTDPGRFHRSGSAPDAVPSPSGRGKRRRPQGEGSLAQACFTSLKPTGLARGDGDAMPKVLLHGSAARHALARGVARLAAAVEPTLGPKGMNVMIDRPIGTPIITRDGVSIAAEIELPERFENMGAQVVREVSMQTNAVAGDGTTTAIVLANALVQSGAAALDRGAKAIDLCRGIDLAVESVLAGLKASARPATDETTLASVATVAATDRKLGALVARAFALVGEKGVITTEFGLTTETTLDVVEGMAFDRGYLSHHMVTDQETMTAALERPLILMTDLKIKEPGVARGGARAREPRPVGRCW